MMSDQPEVGKTETGYLDQSSIINATRELDQSSRSMMGDAKMTGISDEKTFQERREELIAIAREFVPSDNSIHLTAGWMPTDLALDLADEVRRLRARHPNRILSCSELLTIQEEVIKPLQTENERLRKTNRAEALERAFIFDDKDKISILTSSNEALNIRNDQLAKENERLKEQIPSSTDQEQSWPETDQERRWHGLGFETGRKLGQDEAGEKVERLELEAAGYNQYRNKIWKIEGILHPTGKHSGKKEDSE